MSDEFNININFITTNSILAQKSFMILKEYIEEETSTKYILETLPQMTSLLKSMQSSDMDLEFLEHNEFKLFFNKIKLLSSYSQVKDFLITLEGKSEEKNLKLLQKELDSILNDNQKSFLKSSGAYIEFFYSLKNSLASGQWDSIRTSWNDNVDYFDSEKISYSQLNSLFSHLNLSNDAKNIYIKIVKNAQEKIAESLWNHFLVKPEDSFALSKFIPDFFQFINWLSSADDTTRNFAGLLEQKHWDNLAYASKIKGFDFFLEKILILSDSAIVSDTDPFKGGLSYHFININTVKIFNQKNINMDVVLKGNNLNLPENLREYFYQKISDFEKKDKRHSSAEFADLDKLLIVYEKQKLESIFVVKNIKSKKTKI